MLSLYCLAVLTHLAGTAMNLKRKLLTLSVVSEKSDMAKS